MKYTIEGFSQAFAMTLKKEVEVSGKKVLRKIDCTDLVILRWFVDFYPNMKKIECDGKQYAWLTHKKLLEDLPLVDITRKAFIERMQKLVEFKILTYKLVKEGGTFSLYGFGENYAKMIEDTVDGQTDTGNSFESTEGGRSNGHGVDGQTANKDISIIDSSIKDTSIEIEIEEPKRKRFTPPTLEEVEAYCRERKNNVNPQKFYDYFTASDWYDSKGKKVRSWKQKVITWESYSDDKKKQNDGKTYGANGIAINQKKSDIDNLF